MQIEFSHRKIPPSKTRSVSERATVFVYSIVDRFTNEPADRRLGELVCPERR
jgi:hypothetical protein